MKGLGIVVIIIGVIVGSAGRAQIAGQLSFLLYVLGFIICAAGIGLICYSKK